MDRGKKYITLNSVRNSQNSQDSYLVLKDNNKIFLKDKIGFRKVRNLITN